MVTPCGEAVHAVIGANARQLEICGRFWDVPMDLVSVVIPAYNSEKWIKATLNSVLAQSYQSLKLSLLTTDQSTGQPRLRSKHWMAFPVRGKFSSRRTEA